ncbi:MAG: histidine kinase [Solirubrobacteraceae bacterium MAG38_C4-C5]|nr:histidine kinase [Candidatus Siliceabacter maunaloa]
MGDEALSRVVGLVRLALVGRLIVVNLTLLYLPTNLAQAPVILGALVVATLTSYLSLRHLAALSARLARRPIYLMADLGLAVAMLILVGPESPLFLYTLGSALMAGVVFGRRGAVIFAALLVAGYGGSLALAWPVRGAELDSFQQLVTLPSLYLLVAAGGAGVRTLLLRQAATEAALRVAERVATVGDERARVAREMHDSVGKTLYGLGMSARALVHRVDGGASDLSAEIAALSASADGAAVQARELIGDLRADTLDLPLGCALRDIVAGWAHRTGVRAELSGQEVDLDAPGVRYELICIVKEALRNVERHAGADAVRVELAREDGIVELTVTDDGRGPPGCGHPLHLEPEGHYGLVGMAERAQRSGGMLELDRAPGGGTVVRTRVPAGDPGPRARGPEAEPIA